MIEQHYAEEGSATAQRLSVPNICRIERLHAASVWAMVGIIWIVQWVHYPMMVFVGEEQFVQMHRFHAVRITPVVGPTMVIELLTGIALAARYRNARWFLALGLTCACFALTYFGAVPLHAQLATGFNAHTHTALVTVNAWRTLAWSIHGVVVFTAWRTSGAHQK